MKRVNIFLKDDVHAKAKILSVLKDTTLNKFFEEAVEEAIKKDRYLLDKIKKQL
ncbi:MAG: hypothetical protein KKG59_00950 [Nanoarchaeota archaeon]|nr:hypothetical protein [Nanoarchaeota archaeon]